MSSILIVAHVERLQERIVNTIKELKDSRGIFITLNKPWKTTETLLGGRAKNIFFIDCVSDEHLSDDVIHIPPDDLGTLTIAIEEFLKNIKGKKFVFFDSLSTLLIYNHEKKVARFIQNLTATLEEEKELKIIACSPRTNAEVLLNEIFNFFDSVDEVEEWH